ncbi:rhodanese-like domain-containing protein [Spirosoma panaciterrae]|uniref:rhodanese-like domain-containing protein n=1 Tax=Spirosoma panaciterrae TaxID=496058 RepID=UPI000363449F|nr:rhodanese-like domain-containing protein [Spirosoma panaciterrae]
MINLLKSVFGGSGNTQLQDVLEQGAVIVDVRSASEFAGGHAKGAVNIPLDQLETKLNKVKSYQKPIVVCCASGMRSARAKAFLSSQGLTNVHDAGSWRNLN